MAPLTVVDNMEVKVPRGKLQCEFQLHVFGFIDVGINPNVQIIQGSKMTAWMASGMITVGVGDNTWAGGENETNYGMTNFLPGSTLKVDGKVVVENGVLK